MSYEEKKITSEVNPSRPTKVTSTHITFKSPGASAVSNAVPPSPLSTPSTSVHPQVSKPVTSAPETTFSSKIPPATSIQEPQVPSADRALNSLSSILHSHLHNHPYGNAVPLAPPVLPSTSDFSLQSLQSTMGQPSEPDPVSQLNIFLQRNKLPEPVIEFQLAAETPPRFYCNLSVGHATIRTPIPYKSKKEAKRVASELWLNACQAFEHGPPSHKGKTVSYIPENTSSHPNQEPACSNVPVNPQKPEPWSTTLNVFLQKNHLEFPEFHFRQRINGISVEVSSSFIKFSDPQRYKSRKEAKEAVCKKVYEELVKQTQQRDSEVANITSTHLPPRALYAQPFYTSQNPNSFVNPQNPSNPMVAPSFEDMDMDPGEDSIEVKDFIMSTTSPIPPTAYMNSISTKALLQEFCRRGGLQFQLVSEPSCKPTVFEIRVHDLTELAADEDEAARKMLAQLSDLIINASSRD
ncbi:hypothetical protein HMI54_007502 [Coelomomyces lativittatus]|nr:hypothetical protein HMI54_007502 [Coelomomyces lativittatus]